MYLRTLLAVVFASLVVTASASATTIYAPPDIPYQQWSDASLVPTPPGSVTVINNASGCPEALGCTGPGLPIELEASWDFIHASNPWRSLRENFLHELGHQFDYRVLSDSDRDAFRRIMSDERQWSEGPSSPKEKFAEAWATCAQRRSLTLEKVELGFGYEFHPTIGQFRAVCRLIRTAYWY